EALTGLVAAGRGGEAAIATEALARALDAILGSAVDPTPVADAAVAGWLAAHALRDAGGDASPQVAVGLENPDPVVREAWRAWEGDPATESGRFHALRRAATEREGSSF